MKGKFRWKHLNRPCRNAKTPKWKYFIISSRKSKVSYLYLAFCRFYKHLYPSNPQCIIKVCCIFKKFSFLKNTNYAKGNRKRGNYFYRNWFYNLYIIKYLCSILCMYSQIRNCILPWNRFRDHRNIFNLCRMAAE